MRFSEQALASEIWPGLKLIGSPSYGRPAWRNKRSGPVSAGLEPARRVELDDFLSGGGLEPIGAAARTSALGWLVDSDCSAESAAAAVSRFDDALPRVTGLRSASDAFGYLDARFGQLADTSTADLETPYQNPECLLVLILSSLFLAMLLVFTVLCLLALCDPVTTFEQWVQQVCGVT